VLGADLHAWLQPQSERVCSPTSLRSADPLASGVQTREAGSAAASTCPADPRAGCRFGHRGLFSQPLGLKTCAAGSADPAEKKNEKKYNNNYYYYYYYYC